MTSFSLSPLNKPFQIYCSEFNANICPGGTQCLESPNQPRQRLCCRSTTAPRVCPDNLDALLRPDSRFPELCTGPGVACSVPGYTCRYSEALTSYVCCGRAPQIARCADGRETYVQDFGELKWGFDEKGFRLIKKYVAFLKQTKIRCL